MSHKINASSHGFQRGDVVCAVNSDGADSFGCKPGTRYVVSRVEATTLTIRRESWWRRLYRWVRRFGLDLGAP